MSLQGCEEILEAVDLHRERIVRELLQLRGIRWRLFDVRPFD